MNKEAAWDAKVAKRKAEAEKLRMKTVLKVERAYSDFQLLENRWDNLVTNAFWNQFIKDHQREAARRITYSRRLILADTMGLGKTFSAYAACDYIRAATAEGDTESVSTAFVHEYIPGQCTSEADLIFADSPTCRETVNHWTEFYLEPREGVHKFVKTNPPAGRRILYVCPSSLDRNVLSELRHWGQDTQTGRPARSIHNLSHLTKVARQMKIDVFKEMADYVVIINYEAWRKDRLLLNDLVDLKFDTVIIDEAHSIKDRTSNAYRGVRQILDGLVMDPEDQFRTISRRLDPVRYVIPMTGTPVLNKPQELYSLLTLVDPKTYPNTSEGENRFLNTYCIMNPETRRWTFAFGGIDLLLKKVGNRLLRRDRKTAGIKTWATTPQIHSLVVDEEAYPEQARARRQMRENAMIMIDEAQGSAVIASVMLAVYTRLRQIETWPAGIEIKDKNGVVKLKVDIEQSQKLDYLIRPEIIDGSFSGEYEGLIPEVCPTERTIVFSQFKAPLREIADRCRRAGIRVAILDGSTSESIRNEIRIDFDRKFTKQETPDQYKYDIVLANYKVGGVGLNLTGATQVIVLDEEWNPGKRDQAFGRADRMGQEAEVSIHIIRMKATIDTWLASIIREKEDMTTGFESGASAIDLKSALESGEL